MKFGHFTFPVGGPACDANCPFCVSKMTGKGDCVGSYEDFEPEWGRFKVACGIAKKSPELTTALLTGKGEPTLYHPLIAKYLKKLKKHGEFPIVELQTNGILMASGKIDKQLRDWHTRYGLQTIAISVVHYEQKKNQKVYRAGTERDHYDLPALIEKLHEIGYSVRLCVMLLKGYIDTPRDMRSMIEFAHKNEVEQLTLRSIEVTEQKGCKDDEVYKWTSKHQIDNKSLKSLFDYVDMIGTKLMQLSFGATVFGVPMDDGKEQNVCLSNCLTETDSETSIRQLIFFPEGRGRIGYSWQHDAATII